MTHLARICAAALILVLPACSAQTPHHGKKPDPKPEPTQQELFEYIRGKLLSLSPGDGINDNLEEMCIRDRISPSRKLKSIGP